VLQSVAHVAVFRNGDSTWNGGIGGLDKGWCAGKVRAISINVVPAKAGTHTPCPLVGALE
jgi:hypothetical protein